MGATLCSEADKREGFGLRPSLGDETDDEAASESEPPKIYAGAKSKQKKESSHTAGMQSGTLSVKKNNSREGVTSLKQRIQERRTSNNIHSDFINGEQESKVYMDVLQDDTVNHLSEALKVTNSIVQKNEDIGDELARQGGVIRNASNDIHIIDQDISETSYMLKGMKSVGGVISNILLKKPKHKAYQSLLSISLEEEGNRRFRAQSAPPILPSLISGETKQEWIKRGVKQLNSTMDVIKDQQLGIKEVLSNQELKLDQFENRVGHMEEKIKSQTQLIESMRKS